MIKKILKLYENLDKLTNKILNNGLKFCFTLCIISVTILLTYEAILGLPLLYHLGLALFKSSMIFGIEFFICALITDAIKKQVI